MLNFRTIRPFLVGLFSLFILVGLSFILNSNTYAGGGNTYYVSPSGSNGNIGTVDKPWRTLQHAADTVQAGDTVLVQDGNYVGFRLETSGTAVNRITFKTINSGVIIDQDGPTSDGIRLNNVSYITIEGFRVENAAEYGIAHRQATATNPVHGLIIRDNTIIGAGRIGLLISQVADSLIENNVIQNSRRHGIYASNAGTDNIIIRGNNISGNGTAGIHFNGDLSVGGDGIISGLIVEENIIHNNVQNALNMDGVQDSLIRNNLFYGNGLNGIRAFRIDGAEGPRGLRFINNTIHVPADGYWCIRITEDLGGNLAFNNILMNDTQYNGSIALDNTNGFASGYNVVIDRFTEDRGDTILSLTEWQQQGYGTGSFISTPDALFVDVANQNYRLKADAPAIDAGTTLFNGQSAPATDILGTSRPTGTAVDMGAYEFKPSLNLQGIGNDQTIYLNWTVDQTLPPTTTWQISFDGSSSNHTSPIINISEATRDYTLTGMTNYTTYQMTLNAMDNGTPILTDTVSVMPTDIFVYLPTIVKP